MIELQVFVKNNNNKKTYLRQKLKTTTNKKSFFLLLIGYERYMIEWEDFQKDAMAKE